MISDSHQRAVKAKIEDRAEAERYRKLRAWIMSRNETLVLYESSDSCNRGPCDDMLYGPTFDAAVDALPESENK